MVVGGELEDKAGEKKSGTKKGVLDVGKELHPTKLEMIVM